MSTNPRGNNLWRTLAIVLSLMTVASLVFFSPVPASHLCDVDQDDVPDIETCPRDVPSAHQKSFMDFYDAASCAIPMKLGIQANLGLHDTHNSIAQQRHRAVSLHLGGTSPPVSA